MHDRLGASGKENHNPVARIFIILDVVGMAAVAPAKSPRVRRKKSDLDLTLSHEARLDAVLFEAGISTTAKCPPGAWMQVRLLLVTPQQD